VKGLSARGSLVAPVGPAPFERHARVTIGSPDDNDAAFEAPGALCAPSAPARPPLASRLPASPTPERAA